MIKRVTSSLKYSTNRLIMNIYSSLLKKGKAIPTKTLGDTALTFYEKRNLFVRYFIKNRI